MNKLSFFASYIHYLVHPFRSHELLLSEDSQGLRHLNVSESIGMSWIFVVLNGFFRILLINLVLFLFLDIQADADYIFSLFDNEDKYIGFYFLILSTILDVIFYPLFMLFFIQFWEFILKIFGSLLGVEDISSKTQDIMSVAMSSQILVMIPVFGGIAQKMASMILMFAGVKKQLNVSTAMAVCIMSAPLVLVLGFFSLIVFSYILGLTT